MTPWRYGDYLILERLGVGGMSEVDLARKVIEEADFVRFLVIKRIKANKVDDEAFVRMFMDEARITAELHHANVAQVYDFGRLGEEYYLALEYVPGMDVRHMINTLRERKERMPLLVALRILCDVLDGLDYAHSKTDTFGRPMHIVHRDVNPRNIMVSIHGDVKLIDFGVARATGRMERTRTDHVKGKFAYMAPEQVSGESLDHRVDVFAAGLTLHELLTGYGPFYGLNQVQIMHRLVSGRLPELGDLPELPDPALLRAVHDKALQRDPALRYQDARTMRRDLERVAEPLGGLPDRRALARFLEYVQPEITDDVTQKLEAWSGPVDTVTRELMPPPRRRTGPITEPGTMSGASMTLIQRTGLMAAGGALVALLAAAVVLGVGVAVALVVVFGEGRRSEAGPVAPDPVVVEAEAAPEVEPLRPAPESVEDAPDRDRPESIEEPAPTVEPLRPAPESVEDAPDRGRPESIEEPAPTVEALRPAPESAEDAPDRSLPESIEESDPAVEPVPVPEPAPGFLSITSTDKGLPILIDGEDTGLVTPQRSLQWPSGTHTVQVQGYPEQTVNLPVGQVKMLAFK